MSNMTEEYVLDILFREFERIIQEGIKNKEDLEIFSKVIDPKFSYNDRNSIEMKIYDTIRYVRSNIYTRTTPKGNFSHIIKDFELDDFPILVNFIDSCYAYSSYKSSPNNNLELLYNFIEKISYIDEDLYSLYHYFYYKEECLKHFSKEIKKQILTYHLKKKHTKTVFSYLLHQGLLNEEELKEIKLTDKQFTELVFTEFKSLTKKSIKVADITSLKKLRNIKGCFTEGVILEIVQKFIKEANNNKSSPDTIEVILSMFFHYLGLNFNDYPDAKLLLTLSIDKEIEV